MAVVRRCLWEIGIGFLMAPRHHSAMRHVAPTRVELGTRTIFNLLGPMSNPAGARRQLVGVFAPEWVRPMAEVLGRLGAERAWVVHGAGMDELTTAGVTKVAEFNNGRVIEFEVDAGGGRSETGDSIDDLKGGEPAHNAALMRDLLGGARGPLRDVVLLNSAAALVVAGRAETLRDGAEIAAGAIDSGAARQMLDRLVAATNGRDARDGSWLTSGRDLRQQAPACRAPQGGALRRPICGRSPPRRRRCGRFAAALESAGGAGQVRADRRDQEGQPEPRADPRRFRTRLPWRKPIRRAARPASRY